MTARITAPIATEQDRRALTHLIARLRPDWDRAGIAAALAKHPDQALDVLAVQALIAATTRADQRTPAVLGLDGDHATRARVALSLPQVTPLPPPADPVPRCDVCGLLRPYHDADHPFMSPTFTAAAPDTIARARAAAFSRDRTPVGDVVARRLRGGAVTPERPP
jgi:hypothetical protein